MTGADICRAYVRAHLPEASADTVEREARRFWELSPTGELDHVFAARDWLEARGIPIPESVPSAGETPT